MPHPCCIFATPTNPTTTTAVTTVSATIQFFISFDSASFATIFQLDLLLGVIKSVKLPLALRPNLVSGRVNRLQSQDPREATTKKGEDVSNGIPVCGFLLKKKQAGIHILHNEV